MRTLSLFAEGGRPKASDLLDRPEFLYGTAGLAGALLAGALVVYFVDRWRRKTALAERAESADELTSFRAMYERGEITEAEYAKLRQKVAERVKPAPPPPAANPAADPSAPTPLPPPPTPPPAARGMSGPLPDDYFDDPPPPGKDEGVRG